MGSFNYRISLAESRLPLGHFISHGLPAPVLNWKDFAEQFPIAGGAYTPDGYTSCELSWPILTVSQYETLKVMIDECLGLVTSNLIHSGAGNKQLFLTLDLLGNGKWSDIRGVPMPMRFPSSGTRPHGMWYNNISLTVNNILIINDVAVGVGA